MKCTCVSTASGWDETNCAYHGKPAKKPFVRFRMLLSSNVFMCPKNGQVKTYDQFRVIEVARPK